MNLTIHAGQRILAVDLICTYYALEREMKAVQICLSVECTVDNIRITTGSMWKHVAYILHSVCLMELCGIVLKNGMYEVS